MTTDNLDGHAARNQFGNDVADKIRAFDRITEAEYLPDSFSIRFQRRDEPEPGFCYLAAAFRSFRHATGEERDQKVTALASVADMDGPPEDFEAARPLLRPVIRHADHGLRPGDVRQLISRAFAPFLGEFAVLDSPAAMAYVNEATVAGWGVTADEVFASAHENMADTALAAMGAQMPRTGPVLASLVDDGNQYVTSLPLIGGWLAGLGAKFSATPIVFVTDNLHMVVAVRLDEPEALIHLIDTATRRFEEAERPISPLPYTIDGHGDVVPFTVPEDHPAHHALSRARRALALQVYAGQADKVRAAQTEDDQTFVASLTGFGAPDGTEFTLTALGHGVADQTLLPEADMIGLATEDADLLIVPWAAAMPILSLTPEDGYNPPRYRVEGFPDADTVQRLRGHSVFTTAM